MTTFSEKARLSRDAYHLVKRAGLARDHMKMGAVGAMAMAGLSAHALVGDGLPALSATAAVVSCVGAGLAAVGGFLSAKRLDGAVVELARSADQKVPVATSFTGLLDAGQVFSIVRAADKVVPDMVSAIAQRRARSWDAALEKDYRPPVRVRP